MTMPVFSLLDAMAITAVAFGAWNLAPSFARRWQGNRRKTHVVPPRSDPPAIAPGFMVQINTDQV